MGESKWSASRGISRYGRVTVLILLTSLKAVSSQNCVDKNPFIKNLKAQGVIIYSTPEPSLTNTCSAEWKTHQTCCDSASLIEYANKDTDSLRNSILGVITELGKAATILEDAVKTLDPIQTELLKLLEHTALRDDIAEFKLFAQYYSVHKNQLTPEQEGCLKSMSQLRTRGLCSTCSGRSQIYFKGEFAQVSEKDCRLTVNTCHQAWRTVINLVDAMTLAQNIVSRLKDSVGASVISINVNAAAPLEIWLRQSQVREQLLLCQNPLTQCPTQAIKGICESLITIQKKTFIEAVISYVLGDLTELALIKSVSVALANKVALIKDKAKQTLAVINNEKIRWKEIQFARTSNLNVLKALYGLATGTETPTTAVAKIVDNLSGNLGTSAQKAANKVTSLWKLGQKRLLIGLLSDNQSFSDIQVTSEKPTQSSAHMNFDNEFP